MSEFFSDAHAIWQYFALAGVLIALAFTFQKEMTRTATIVYRIGSAAVTLQVLLGIIVWFLNSGWSLGFMQGWLHPIIGIAAAGVVDVFRGRGVRTGGPEGQKTVRTGFLIVTVLVIAAIGIAEMA